mgnify:CR=1 FL=1
MEIIQFVGISDTVEKKNKENSRRVTLDVGNGKAEVELIQNKRRKYAFVLKVDTPKTLTKTDLI